MLNKDIVLNAITYWEGGLTEGIVDHVEWRAASGIRVEVKRESTNCVGYVLPLRGDTPLCGGVRVSSRLKGNSASSAEQEAFDLGMLLLRFARFGVPPEWRAEWRDRYEKSNEDTDEEDKD